MTTTVGIPLVLILIVGLFVLGGTGVFAVILIRSGKRGRLVNDHPICRACGFDLYNLPGDRAKCPECGADITEPKAVLPGRREPFMGRLWFGRALLAILLVVVVTTGWRVVAQNDLSRLKPTVWLSLETRLASYPTQQRAWKEISRRASAGTLSDANIASLADAALDLQGDLSRTWISEAGSFIENARRNGRLADAQWTRYAKQAPQLSLLVRGQVGRSAKYLPAEVRFAKARSAESSTLVLRSEEGLATGDCIRVLPEWQRGRSSSGFTLSSGASGSNTRYIHLDPKVLPTTRPGKRTVTVEVPIRICEGWEDDDAEVLAETRTFTAEWELVDAENADIALLPDDSPELRAQVEKAISIGSIEFKPHPSNGDRVDVTVIADGLPVPVAYRVTFRAGERTWDGFNFKALPTSGEAHFGNGFSLKQFDPDRVDVIFEPSIDAAIETTHMTQLWNGRLVIKDVPVTRPASATQPGSR